MIHTKSKKSAAGGFAGVHLDTVLGWLSLNRSLGLKAKYENEHLTPALSPFCYRKTRRGSHAPSVFLNHAINRSWPQKRTVSRYARLAVVLAAMALFSRARGQTVVEPPQRWLLVFDTSITMKGCLPATATELQDIFISSMTGQLREGDSVGVWTFGEKLRAAQYPQFVWIPSQAASAAAGLNDFIKREHYLGDTTFSALWPTLRQVIAHSQRLTIVIFCDGQDTFKLTPYDDGINRVLKQMRAARHKSQAPFVVVVRTQNGQCVGATVNLPPGNLDLPPFPLLPQAVEVLTTNAPSSPADEPVIAPPVVTAPPLVIVGTNVITNPEEIKKATGP
jgi:hypothetical protein